MDSSKALFSLERNRPLYPKHHSFNSFTAKALLKITGVFYGIAIFLLRGSNYAIALAAFLALIALACMTLLRAFPEKSEVFIKDKYSKDEMFRVWSFGDYG